MSGYKTLPLDHLPETRERILTAIRGSSEPLPANSVGKLLSGNDRVAGAMLTALLDDLVTAGQLHRLPGTTAKAKPRYWDRDLRAVTRSAVLDAVRGADRPVLARELSRRLPAVPKVSPAELNEILDSLVAAGTLHHFPGATAKAKPRYWDRGALEFGRVAITKALDAKGPQAEAALRKGVKGLSDEQFRDVIRTAIAAGTLWRHPPLKKSKTGLLGSRPPAPEPYLQNVAAELSDVVPRLLSAKVPPEAVRRALVQMIEAAGIPFGAGTSASRDETVSPAASVDLIALMRRIEPGADRGALVGARDLRRAARMEKPQFDRAVMKLSRDGRLSLHRHDYAASLSQSERDELVADDEGTYYVGMALRQSD